MEGRGSFYFPSPHSTCGGEEAPSTFPHRTLYVEGKRLLLLSLTALYMWRGRGSFYFPSMANITVVSPGSGHRGEKKPRSLLTSLTSAVKPFIDCG